MRFHWKGLDRFRIFRLVWLGLIKALRFDVSGLGQLDFIQVDVRLAQRSQVALFDGIANGFADKGIAHVLADFLGKSFLDQAARRTAGAKTGHLRGVAQLAEHLVQLGVDPAKGMVAGDMKFDAPLLERTKQKMTEIRQRCGVADDAFILVAGSTRPGEEAIIANSFIELRNDHPNLTMVIAPRHIERIDEIKALLEGKGIDFADFDDNQAKQRVVLVNRVGILNDLYLGANVSFVGGTLVDIGGHNVLEPVWAGSPVLFGPSVFNVKESVDYIMKNNFGAMVQSEEELVSLLKKMLSGDILYATKQSRDLDSSPTAAIGDYILEKLTHA